MGTAAQGRRSRAEASARRAVDPVPLDPRERWLRQRVRREFAVGAAVMLVLGILIVRQDWFPALAGWDARHPAAHAGDLLMFAGLSHLVMVVFGARRGRDLRVADVERHAKTRELEHLAHHDFLTGLLNRAGFAAETARALAEAERTGRGFAILLLDLDRFKEVNDTLGHEIGDLLLSQVALRLRSRLRATDVVARLGGDEFAVLLPGTGAGEDAAAVASDLVAALADPIVVGEVALEVGTSVGVAGWLRDGDTVSTLLRHADVAMYAAKGARTGVETYGPHLDIHSPQRLALHGELRRAIEACELVVHYQPQASLREGRITGVEALVRWPHPTRGMLSPAEFLPVAETTGLIRPLTTYVLRTALQDLRRWRDTGLDLTVAVNLSAHSLIDADLPDAVAVLLHDAGLPPEVLELEITESHAMADPRRAGAVLARLHALGVRLAIDDFGTGHSALAYLGRLPVDVIKIDQSFVRDMTSDEHAHAIVRSTLDLARNLGLAVVAEGVENAGAWRDLQRLRCDAAQGFWLARPGPADELPRTVAELAERLAGPWPPATPPGAVPSPAQPGLRRVVAPTSGPAPYGATGSSTEGTAGSASRR